MKMFNLFNWVQNLVKFCTLNWDDDDGGAPPVQQSTSYSTNLPEYAQPYYTELLKQTGKQTFTTDDTGKVTGVKAYTPYTGERVAGFTPEQLALQQQIGSLTAPTEFNQAGAGLSSLQSLGLSNAQTGLNRALGYAPGTISSQNINAPGLTNYQMAGPSSINAPSLQEYKMNAAKLAYNPNLTKYQMGPAQNVAASNIASQLFDEDAADFYMSPYAEAAIAPALREARLQGDLQKQAGMLGSLNRGTFGGARQTLLQAEQERGTQRTMADITATGMEKAYQNAQAQFQADQARQLQAQQANQQYGLQAQLANQQAGLTTGQQNLAALLGVQQLGTQSSLQAELANLSNAQQANVQNLASQLQTQGLSSEQAMRAALANQQAQQSTQQQNLAALLGVQQLGSGQTLDAQRANQAAALQAAQLTQQGQQYAAGLGKDVGLAGLSTTLEGAKALGALGATEQQANLERLKAQAATAEEKQALQQQINDLQFQKFQEQQNYQRNLLDYYSNILRGNAGALGSTQVQYTPAPSQAQQIASLGLSGLSLYKALS
jgi:hypothetical protein